VATRFFGQFQHTLDDKGRLILPAEFRKALEDGAFVGPFPGGCLVIYTSERFDEVSEDITQSAKAGGTEEGINAARSFFSSVQQVTPDRQGRILIAPRLRDAAHLERDVIVTGQQNRIELWAPERWEPVEELGQAELARRPSWGM
jgi:MraZ protein